MRSAVEISVTVGVSLAVTGLPAPATVFPMKGIGAGANDVLTPSRRLLPALGLVVAQLVVY